jgi:hypothetical protein
MSTSRKVFLAIAAAAVIAIGYFAINGPPWGGRREPRNQRRQGTVEADLQGKDVVSEGTPRFRRSCRATSSTS